MSLRSLGLSAGQERSWKRTGEAGRIANLSYTRYLALTEAGWRSGFLPRARTSSILSVGDWVDIDPDGRIVSVLPRRTWLSRRTAGRRSDEQILAANVDYAFLVQGLDGDFNVARIERYLAMVRSGGVAPVIVLTKSDVAPDLDGQMAAVRAAAASAPVFAVCAPESRGLEPLSALLTEGITAVFLGSSGAGKSTLLNVLLGREAQATAAVRRDSKGRHTTTSRMLFEAPGGAFIIDTPGMRELQLYDAEAGVALTFPEIEEAARGCRFRDCTHTEEPGCAVVTAVEKGEIERDRLVSYLKLTVEAQAQAERLKRRGRDSEHVKSISKIVRDIQAVKRGYRSGL